LTIVDHLHARQLGIDAISIWRDDKKRRAYPDGGQLGVARDARYKYRPRTAGELKGVFNCEKEDL